MVTAVLVVGAVLLAARGALTVFAARTDDDVCEMVVLGAGDALVATVFVVAAVYLNV